MLTYPHKEPLKIRQVLFILVAAYLFMCVTASLLVMAAATRTGQLGDYIPWLHWPVKVMIWAANKLLT